MGEAQKYLRGTRLMPILPHKIGISKRILTSRAGLIVVAQLMQRLGLETIGGSAIACSGQQPRLPSRRDVQYFHVAVS